MKTIYLSYSFLGSTLEFQESMRQVAREIGSLPNIEVSHTGQYPEVTAGDVLWYETYREKILGASLIIVVLDFPSQTLERIIRNRSVLDLPLWCFVPRGRVVTETISGFINQHLQRCKQNAVQRVFPYDHPSNISSWVRSVYTSSD